MPTLLRELSSFCLRLPSKNPPNTPSDLVVVVVGGGGGGIGLTMCDISEEFRAALCISGGSRRSPPTLPPPDLAGGGDDEGGVSGGEEEDRLSALPDDVLLLILCRLRNAAAAARISVLSGRWRRLWAQLPELWFPHPAEPARALPWPAVLPLPASRAARTRHRWGRLMAYLWARRSPLPAEQACALSSSAAARAALAQHSAPSLWKLRIIADDADPGDTTAVLRLAAPRLTSTLFFGNVVPEGRWNEEMTEAMVTGAIELPCFDRAEKLLLNLGYLCLALPPSGVFTKLTELVLSHVWFQGGSDIGDTFSSARCPSLRLLSLEFAQGVSHFSICSDSLLNMHLHLSGGLQQLTVVSPMLRELHIRWCFKSQPVADITAPVLEKLWWDDAYDPRSVQLGKLAQLRDLATSFFAYTTHGLPQHQYNLGNVMLLQRYRKIADLRITIKYPICLVHIEYLMEAALTLPPVMDLHLILETRGHRIGSCVFHFLKISTSIKRLFLNIREVMKEKTSCLPGCFCHGKEIWETEALVLNSLQELYICGFNGSYYDFAFVKRLLGWAGKLKSAIIEFDPQETVDEDLCKELQGLSGPKTCVKIYLYRNGAKVKYTP